NVFTDAVATDLDVELLPFIAGYAKQPAQPPPQHISDSGPQGSLLFLVCGCNWFVHRRITAALSVPSGADHHRSIRMRLALLAAAALVVAVPAFARAADVTPLVTAEWLKTHAADENVVILAVRDKIEDTDLGALPYIANAVVAPYASAGWRTEVDGVPAQI